MTDYFQLQSGWNLGETSGVAVGPTFGHAPGEFIHAHAIVQPNGDFFVAKAENRRVSESFRKIYRGLDWPHP